VHLSITLLNFKEIHVEIMYICKNIELII
jgi:hypothetical protein